MIAEVRKLFLFMSIVFAFAMTMVSCKPSVPGRYIQPGKMADILYEYHLAEQIFNMQGGDSIKLFAFRETIFKKYGVDEAEFDSSMVYYTRHTRQLYKVYEKIGDKLSDELTAQGGSNATLEQYGMNVAGADTSNIWKGDRSFILMPYAMKNIYTIEEKADTSFHKGDRIILDFDAQFLFQDGVRSATAVVAVTYANDSVVTKNTQMSSSSHYHLQIEDDKKVGIKKLKGYFIMSNDPNGGSSTTLRMAVVYNVKMLKMHVQDKTEDKAASAADTKSGAMSQSQRGDTAKTPKPNGGVSQSSSNGASRQVHPTGVKGLSPAKVQPMNGEFQPKPGSYVGARVTGPQKDITNKGRDAMPIMKLKPLKAHPTKK